MNASAQDFVPAVEANETVARPAAVKGLGFRSVRHGGWVDL